jgi:hypothetical protein
MQTVLKDEWIAFLADFTRRNRGAHGRLEVLGGDTGYQVETEDRPFNGVAADVKHGEHTIWISFGSTPSDHLAHGVHGAVAVYALPASKRSGEVFAADPAMDRRPCSACQGLKTLRCRSLSSYVYG